MSVLNAFQAVRPRAAEAPSAVPHTRGRGAEPLPLPGTSPRHTVLDSNGKRCVPLAPRLNGAFAIESGVVAQAVADKRQALLRGSI